MYCIKAYHALFGFGLFLTVIGCNNEAGSLAPPAEEPALSMSGYLTDITASAGLADFRHNTGGFGERWFPEIMGSGGGFVDYDGDGRLDIVLVGGGHLPSRPIDSTRALTLFRNTGSGSFVDATGETGLAPYQAYGMGVIAADYDNDGDADLFLTTLGTNLLFRNDQGRFTEVGAEAGVATNQNWSASAIFFDADRDGLLDLYVANYVDWSPETDVACVHENVRDFCNPLHYAAIQDDFYRNNGDGTFTLATAPAGLLGPPDMGSGKGLGVVELDFNRDGWSDVYVANDGDRNFLFQNNGDGTFSEVAERSGVAFDRRGAPRAGMGVDAGVVDSTGQITLFVGNFSQETVSVWRHQQNGFFVDRSTVSGIGFPTRQTLTFGLVLFDLDLDTDLDLMLANGNVIEQIASMQDGVTFREKPQLFLNQGNGNFDEFQAQDGPLTQELLARGLATGDIDGDGDLDVLLTENNGPAHLWQNNQEGNSYLRVKLHGTESNRDGIGARVLVTLDGLTMEQVVRSGSSYASQSEKILTFGLARNQNIPHLEVQWPSGKVDSYENVASGQTLVLIEGDPPQ